MKNSVNVSTISSFPPFLTIPIFSSVSDIISMSSIFPFITCIVCKTFSPDRFSPFNNSKLELNLLYNSDSVTEKTISEYLQAEYKKIGIAINIIGQEEQSYRDNMKAGNFDMVFNICWGTPYDPQSSLAAMRQRVYGDYAAQLGLEDKAEIDEAITKILVSTDEEERQNLYTFVLTRLHEDAVYIPLTYECNKAIYTSDLKNVKFTQTQYEVPFAEMTFGN